MEVQIRTQEEVLEELLGLLTNGESAVEGSFSYDVLASNAVEFGKVELELAVAYQNSFLHTCQNEFLDLRAGECGVYRRAGKKAVGELEVTGAGVVKAGNVFATADNIRFVAVSDTAIEGSGTVAIEALIEGASSNVAAETITRIPLNIPGIRGCNNPAATYDGYDEESDESLRERALEKIRFPISSGNPASYINWAMSVTGVGAVRVQRCWNGAGTVKVVIIDSNFEAANVDLLTRVYEKIEAERPIGAEVSVVSAAPRAINIKAAVRGVVDVKEFRESVERYFVRMTNQTLTTYESNGALDYVSAAKIGALIIAAGAEDYTGLTINDGAGNVALGFEDIPVLGRVEFS